MAKRLVYICDGKDCGAVLIHAEHGYVLTGGVKATLLEAEGSPPYLVSPAKEGEETALCRECLKKALGL